MTNNTNRTRAFKPYAGWNRRVEIVSSVNGSGYELWTVGYLTLRVVRRGFVSRMAARRFATAAGWRVVDSSGPSTSDRWERLSNGWGAFIVRVVTVSGDNGDAESGMAPYCYNEVREIRHAESGRRVNLNDPSFTEDVMNSLND